MGVILMAILTSDYGNPMEYGIIQGGSFFLLLVFACCKIHGVRKDNNRFINSYIVFKLIIFVVFFAVGIFLLVSFSGRGCILFIYYMGALIVLYNLNHHFNSQTNYKNLAFTN